MSGAPHSTGGCLCGAVRYEVHGSLRGVVNCHCGQCRRSHGHHGAYSQAARDDLKLIEDRGLAWYDSSAAARRGFCAACGSSLFWERKSTNHTSIAAGSFDQPSGRTTIGNIFTAERADYYAIDDGLAQWPGSMGTG